MIGLIRTRRRRLALAFAALAVAWAAPASAQLDPLLVAKRTRPNVIFVVDTAERMQRDADEHYYDPSEYTRGQAWDPTLGVTVTNTSTRYRRRYESLVFLNSGGDKYSTSRIAIQGDLQAGYNTTVTGTSVPLFYAKTRLAVAKAAMLQALNENRLAVRFGLIRTRQSSPAVQDEQPVFSLLASQQSPFPTEAASGRWKVKRGYTTQKNSSIEGTSGLLVQANSGTANTDIPTILNRSLTTAGALIAAGQDSYNYEDAPLAHMLDDARAEAVRLINLDINTERQCRNTVVVLIAGGGEGTDGHVPSAESTASTFGAVGGRRVPIYVVAIAPSAGSVAQLQAIAANSGGQYFEIDKTDIETAAAVASPVPEAVRAINTAIQHAFAAPADVNTLPTASLPYGPQTESQVTSPIVGTVDLYGAYALDGSRLPDSETRIQSATGTDIPQRSNVMVTAGFALPGFEGRLRGFRVYKPVPDITKPSGYKFVADGRALWVAQAPAAADRNIYTVLPNGSIIDFDASNLGTLTPYLNTFDPSGLIEFVRSQPLGAILSSTPAIMDPPSVDPPPDPEYPAFIAAHKNRRSLVFVGMNDGMFHAFDSRTGLEVWAVIPFNLLPKLKALRDGQSFDSFDYFVDSSPKLADVRVDHDGDGDTEWRTHLYIGEGAGGTFYQTFDVTLDDIDAAGVGPTDSVSEVLSYFSHPDRIQFEWAFPRYSTFNPSIQPHGDVSFAAPYNATDAELSVGQTWSDPAVGQIANQDGKYAVLTGSGFLSRGRELWWNRKSGAITAGTTFYLLDAGTGAVYDYEQVPSDNFGETIENCAASGDCRNVKNALQADPVATGPPDSRFITRAYLGDLDGNVWRFNVATGSTGSPEISGAETRLYAAGRDHPLFASMAAVTVGTSQYLFFGSGSDLLPSNGVNYSYKLFGLLEGNNQPTFQVSLTRVDSLADDEKVSAFPAVAGDIVFFTTTSFKPVSLCTAPDANLYAFTFIGGAAYDATGDNKVSNNETPKVKTLVGGGRATAPFIVDQHLIFGAGSKLSLFGDPQDFNNGVGQIGVRILSWREQR